MSSVVNGPGPLDRDRARQNEEVRKIYSDPLIADRMDQIERGRRRRRGLPTAMNPAAALVGVSPEKV